MNLSSPDNRPLAEALRRHRLAAALSQELLAERSSVSVRTVHNLERGRITAPRLGTIRALAEALGLDAAARAQLFGSAQRDTIPAASAAASDSGTTGQPAPVALAPLIGRRSDLRGLVDAMLAGRALVTLTGLAGIGKTRLAREVVRDVGDRAREGPGRMARWWVPLGALDDPAFIVDALARATDADTATIEAIGQRIGDRPGLVVLDNLEHLPGAAAVVADLLAALPTVRVLATSRAPVGVPGEHEWPVTPLPIPPEDATDPVDVAKVASVELLVDRIGSSVPDFTLTIDNAPVVAEICRRLDGLPLALELAAKHWRVLGGAGVLESIRRAPLELRDIHRPDGGVHDSLHAAIEASYRLLPPDTGRALQALTVFRGGWTVEAAGSVLGMETVAAGSGGDPVAHLDRLIAAGMVTVSDAATGRRFSILPTIRAFAATRATDAGIVAQAAARHAEYIAGWAPGRIEDMRFGSAVAAGHDLDAEVDNLRAALRWCCSHSPAMGLELAFSLSTYWRSRSRHDEGLMWFQALLDRVDDNTEAVARAQQRAAWLACYSGRIDVARALATESLARHRRRDDLRGCTEALRTLGLVETFADPRQAVRRCREAAALAEAIGDPKLLIPTLHGLAGTLGQCGDIEGATAVTERVITLARSHDFPSYQARGMINRVSVLWVQAEFVEADRQLSEIEPLLRQVGEVGTRVFLLALRAAVSAQLGDLERAFGILDGELSSFDDATGRDAILRTWVGAEVALAAGEAERATSLARTLLSDARKRGQLIDVIEYLALLASAASDPQTAALAVAAGNTHSDAHGLTVPPLFADRLRRTADRWTDTLGADRWADLLASAAGHRLDDILHSLAEPGIPARRGGEGAVTEARSPGSS